MNRSKVLITGDTGFIGSKFCDLLKKNNIGFYGLSRSNGKDITKWDDIKDIRGIDIFYHFASPINLIENSFQNKYEIFNTNSLGTLNMLELAHLNAAQKFIFLSSAAIYGEPLYSPVDENHPLMGNNFYAKSKMIAECFCKSYNKDYDLNITILRLFNIYGNGLGERFLIQRLLKQSNEEYIELNNTKSERDFFYIDDLTNLLYSLLDKDLKGFNVFNIGSGKSYSIKEIIDIISKIKNKNIKIKSNENYDEVLSITADITKAKEMLSWKPKINLEEGLRRMIQ